VRAVSRLVKQQCGARVGDVRRGVEPSVVARSTWAPCSSRNSTTWR
jgi:hypothetical protein